MSITTRTGDDGQTSLVGGERVPKNDPRVATYGDVDELNAVIGVARAQAVEVQTHSILEPVQHDLFRMGAVIAALTDKDLAMDIPQITVEHVEQLDSAIKTLENQLTPLTGFIIPAGNIAAAHLHLARTICRRAERSVFAIKEHYTIPGAIHKYLNRLSDVLFLLARLENGGKDVIAHYK